MAKTSIKHKRQRQTTKGKVPSIVKWVLLSFVLVIIVSALTYYFTHKGKEDKSFSDAKYSLRGVDLSHHNPIIDWKEIKDKNGISFVYLKATGGVNHEDRNYIYNYESAKNANLKVGSYHFYLFGISGAEQAKHFIGKMKYQSGDLYPAIDVEHSTDNVFSRDTAFVNLVISELKVLENELYEYYGVHPVIYTNRECYKLYISTNFKSNMIWMCDLKGELNDVDNWIIWQFSHKGQLNGVVGEIDLNYFRYSNDEFYKITLP